LLSLDYCNFNNVCKGASELILLLGLCSKLLLLLLLLEMRNCGDHLSICSYNCEIKVLIALEHRSRIESSAAAAAAAAAGWELADDSSDR
jgi:hypothetical protein